jgi:predicted nucleic acid-binding protein
MALDALIAVSARRHKTTVVTVNYSDSEAIRYYCNVRVVKASDLFRR